MLTDDVILINVDLVPQYEDAGVAEVISSVARQYKRGAELLATINQGISMPDLTWEAFCYIFSDLQAAGFLKSGDLLLGEVLPTPISRPARIGGIASDGSFFSTPTTGVAKIRVYKFGEVQYISEERDLSIDRSIITTGFQVSDVMQVALEVGGVIGWWGRQTIA